MSNNLARLLSVASEPICSAPAVGELPWLLSSSENLGQDLMKLLRSRNGFYAFESALLFRPLDFDGPPLGLFQWNNAALWKSEYKAELKGAIFFAEDIFGLQFCIRDNSVNSFEPETGEFQVVAANLEEWSGWILEDSKTRTGWPLAHSWQLRQGALESGTRLLPKVPFVLGGQFVIDNLYELQDVEGMRFRANIANQLRDCPDGSKVVLNIRRDK